MSRIVAIVNQKGGVGKTTSAVNLTAALREKGAKVLLVDFDPQANATSGLGVSRRCKYTSYDVIINGVPAEQAIVHTQWGDLIPSSSALAGAGVELAELDRREFILKQALEPVTAAYDFVFIDCPPSLELLTLNGLCAAQQILIPVQCEYYGVLLTMFDGRTNFSSQVAQEVRRFFPGRVYGAAIPRNVRLAEAPSHGMPITAYDKHSKGAKAYRDVAEEILARS